MKITYLGQAGFLFRFEPSGLTVMVDPYLSNGVVKVNPRNYRRKPVDERFLSIVPDILILTHNHLDHTDPDTLCYYLGQSEKRVTVLAPEAAWAEAKKFGNGHNYVRFNRHSEWTEGDVHFKAVKADHTDVHPIGMLIRAEGKTLYITGDTLYNEDIFEDIPTGVDLVFVPINGVGNNMNALDARRFCERIRPKTAVPVHWGLFDNIDPTEAFAYPDRLIPTYYEDLAWEPETK